MTLSQTKQIRFNTKTNLVYMRLRLLTEIYVSVFYYVAVDYVLI